MKINYELTKEDYIEFNMHHIAKSKSVKRTLFIERYVISIMFLIVPFIIRNTSSKPLPFFYLPFIVIYILWLVFFPKYFNYSIKRRLDKFLNKNENSSMFTPQSLSITDVGIFEFDNMEKSKVTMKEVQRVDVTASHIFIYVSDVNAYIIPFRAFKTLSEKNELIDLLKKYCTVCVE